MIADFIFKLESIFWGLPFIIFVMLVGFYFTVRSGFFPFVKFGHILKYTAGSIRNNESNAKKDGSISPFEAVCIAIGGCVGAGNISGVASAIAVGGPGAIFWLWIWAFFGMMVKLVETSLGCYYRSQDEKGEYYGGPMEYMEKGIGREMGIKFGYVLGAAFCVGFILQFIQGSQAYTISEMLNNSFKIPMMATTVVYTIIILYVVWKGTPRIAKFATIIVPIMCVVYLLGGIIIVILNIQNVPSVIQMIFKDAFTGTAAAGGFVGATVTTALRSGLNRSINSNEAGQGSSPLIHSSANTVHPMRQGLWGAFEVFVDTIIVCSVTAIAILCTGVWSNGETGATLTMTAFETSYGMFGRIFMGIMAVLFGLTTTAGWYTYYVAVIRHLLRKKTVLRDNIIQVFKVLFPCMNIIIVGYITMSGNDADLFWSLVSCVLAVPVFTNLIALVILRKKFWEIFKDYKARYFGIGKVDPDFHVFYEDNIDIKNREESIRKGLEH
ncbi:sodium:alanine symporter family protein [Anaerotignum faecicola]|nr:sodium:alanine symporter family protein [Anaerotignum faecicola]